MDEVTPSFKYINSKFTELTTYKHTPHSHSVRPSRLTIGLGKCDIFGRILSTPWPH